MKSKLLLLSLLAISGAAIADTITVSAKSHYTACAINQDCYLKSVHDISINNTSDKDHYYTYSYSLCADNNQCHSAGNAITVKARTTWNNHYDNFLIAGFSYRGNHQYWAKTDVYGHQEASDVSNDFIIVN
jgi:hypothetical protein